MPAFEYSALDERGRNVRGVLDGSSPRQVRQMLREQGLSPLSVETLKEQEPATENWRLLPFSRTKLSTRELALVFRQLATLVHAAVPLEEALTSISVQAVTVRARRAVLGLRGGIAEGRSLADSMRELSGTFGEMLPATIDAGEQSGRLDAVLERLASYVEARRLLQERVLLALAYPTVLTLVAIAIVIGLLSYVVPQVLVVFEDTQQALPLLTRGLIALSDFLADYGLLLGASCSLTLAGGLITIRSAAGLAALDRVLFAMPAVRFFVRGINIARFTRTLEVLVSSGVPLLEALRTSAGVMTNRHMREKIGNAADRVREGVGLARALDDTRLFPPVALQLVASGEASSNVAQMLDRAAAEQERELESLTSGFLAVLEPVLILVMGGIVLLIVLAILMPIFEMNQLIH